MDTLHFKHFFYKVPEIKRTSSWIRLKTFKQVNLNPPELLISWFQSVRPASAEKLQMEKVPSPWSSGPKHFTNAGSPLLNCLEPLDQRGSAQTSSAAAALGVTLWSASWTLYNLNLLRLVRPAGAPRRASLPVGQVMTHLSSPAAPVCSHPSHSNTLNFKVSKLPKSGKCV